MTARSRNRIAILILTYNHEKYIGACLESILHSGLANWHAWVLDDGSSDATRDVADAFARENHNITIIYQDHSGGNTAKSSQRLIDESFGEYVVLMSGDDMFGPTMGIARSVATLDATPNLAAVIPRMVYLMQDSSCSAPACHETELLAVLRTGEAAAVLDHHLYRSVSRIFLQGMVIRRSIVEGFGGFDVEALADDYAFVMRLFGYLRAIQARFLFDESSLWLYRVHSTNVHRDPVRQFALIAQVVQKYVPSERRQDFFWDAMILEDGAQWGAVRQHASRILGAEGTAHALAPAIRVTIRAAARRGDISLICKILFSPGLNMSQRALSAFYLPKAIMRNLIPGRYRCRLRN